MPGDAPSRGSSSPGSGGRACARCSGAPARARPCSSSGRASGLRACSARGSAANRDVRATRSDDHARRCKRSPHGAPITTAGARLAGGAGLRRLPAPGAPRRVGQPLRVVLPGPQGPARIRRLERRTRRRARGSGSRGVTKDTRGASNLEGDRRQCHASHHKTPCVELGARGVARPHAGRAHHRHHDHRRAYGGDLGRPDARRRRPPTSGRPRPRATPRVRRFLGDTHTFMGNWRVSGSPTRSANQNKTRE